MARAKPSRASVGRYGHDGSCVITLASLCTRPSRSVPGANSIQLIWLRQRQTRFVEQLHRSRDLARDRAGEPSRKESPQDKTQVERVYGVTATVPILC